MKSELIAAIGISYRTASIGVRERLYCSLDDLPGLEQLAHGRFAPVKEIFLLSTCNRIELYVILNSDGIDVRALMVDLLAEISDVETAFFADLTYFYTGESAAEHLCRVAAGLDSMVLGEPQILGQVINAFMVAVNNGQIGPVLTELLRTAIRSGKRTRTETAISRNPISTSAIAVAQAEAFLGDLTAYRHLIIGLGEMGQLALKALKSRGVTNIALVNRTRSKAAALADSNGLTVYGLNELTTAVATSDVVITATTSTEPLLTVPMIKNIAAERKDWPLILIDIAVPRNVAAAVSHIPGVYLRDADQLQVDLDEALATRRHEIPHIESIIAAEMDRLTLRLNQLVVLPVIADLRQKAENIRQQALDRVLRHLGEVDPETLRHLQLFSRSLVNKLLHEPTVRLRDRAANQEVGVFAHTVRDLFGLEISELEE